MKGLRNVPMVIGTKQTIKQIMSGKAEKVILAADTDDFIQKKVREACLQMNVPLLSCKSKYLLGKESGIERDAAVIAVLKD